MLPRRSIKSHKKPFKERHLDPLEPLTPMLTFGTTVSTLAVNVPSMELSPNDESAQKVKALLPSFNGTLQFAPEQLKGCPFSVPSIAVML